MKKSFFYPASIIALVAVFVTEPIVSYAQTNITANDLIVLEGLSKEIDGQVILSSAEKKLWEDLISSQSLDEKDKRLTNYVLPALAKDFGQIHVDILKDYATEDQQQSRLLATSTGVSPRFFAKAASITSLGTMTCADPSVLFPRELEAEKTLWLNSQTKSPNSIPFFGRSFDVVARQSLLLPLRSFTNRPTSSQSWSNMLQQVAKAEIEERFDLQSGLLANTTSGELGKTIAKGRIARQLGLARLPDPTGISSFYAAVGQQQVEQALDLPSNSLVSRNDTRFWYETYQNIGFRVLEEELELPDSNSGTSPFPATVSLTELPRFQLLAKRLETRGSLYQDPVLALGLPIPSYLPTDSSGSDIYNRLKNGDPDAFAAVGAYFLGDSLQLSAAAIAELVQSVLRGENRAVNLATAHPLEANLKAEQLFSSEMTTNQRAALFESIGQLSKENLTSHLAQINGNVLVALTGSGQAPTESTVTSSATLTQAVSKLAEMSAVDADYPDGLTAAALQRRGEQLLGSALAIDPAELRRLTEPNDSAIVTSIAQKVDDALGWPNIGDQPFSRLYANGKLTDRQLLETGINQLWTLFALPPSIKTGLTGIFFDEVVAPVNDDGEEIVTDDEPTNSTSNPIDSDSTTTPKEDPDEEIVVFAIPADALSLTESLTIATGIDAENQIPLLTGRVGTGLKILTLSEIAKVMSGGSTLTIPKLLELYNQPTAAMAESITTQTNVGFSNDFFSQDLFDGIKSGNAWPAIESEIVRQWNIDCPGRSDAAQNAIDRLLETMMEWTETTNDPTEEATRPVQVFTFKRDEVATDVSTTIKEKYPTAADSKTGLFSNPRNWDDIYIGL